jgi:hypothetical protein
MMRTIVLLACVLLPVAGSAQDEFWCWNMDEIRAKVEGDTVRLAHLAALINCCPDPITYTVTVGDASILVEERSQTPCDCECCYNLSVTLENVPPGPWNVVYRWFDTETQDWTEQVLQITVPDVGQSYTPEVAGQEASGCLPATHAGEPPVPSSWGMIKATYR